MVQVKACRLTPPLLGQVFFSSMLAIRAGANSAASVALCGENDPELEEVALEIAREQNIDIQIIARRAPRPAATFRLRPDLAAIERTYRREPRLNRGQLYVAVPLSVRQQAHAAVFFDGPWSPGESFDSRRLILLSHPGGYGFGMYVLGEALIGRELTRRIHPSAAVDCGVVVPRDDAVMRGVAQKLGIAVFKDTGV